VSTFTVFSRWALPLLLLLLLSNCGGTFQDVGAQAVLPAAVLAGCPGVSCVDALRIAPSMQDTRPHPRTVALMPEPSDIAAKQFTPPPGRANLYVTSASTRGHGYSFQIYMDGQRAGTIAPPDTYLLYEVVPGEHRISVVGENQDSIIVRATAGENYFVGVVPSFGYASPRAKLEELRVEEGEKAVQNAKRVEGLGGAAGKPPSE